MGKGKGQGRSWWPITPAHCISTVIKVEIYTDNLQCAHAHDVRNGKATQSFSIYMPTSTGRWKWNVQNQTKPNINAGSTPFHHAASYLTLDTKQHRFDWLLYDNDGSFNGWFDCLTPWMRVGYWSPFVILSLLAVYIAIFLCKKPQPLEFSAIVLHKLDKLLPAFWEDLAQPFIDLCIYLWGIVVMVYTKKSFGIRCFLIFHRMVLDTAYISRRTWIYGMGLRHEQ